MNSYILWLIFLCSIVDRHCGISEHPFHFIPIVEQLLVWVQLALLIVVGWSLTGLNNSHDGIQQPRSKPISIWHSPDTYWLGWSTQHKAWNSHLLTVVQDTVSLQKNVNRGNQDSLVATSSHSIITKGVQTSNEADTVDSKSRETGPMASLSHWIKLLQTLSQFWTFH